MRTLRYNEAISEALVQAMKNDESIFIMGEGVDDPKGIFNTTLEAHKKFGSARVFDVPLSENAVTGIGIGSAIAGMRPVMVHARVDFLMLAMDQIINHAAKWKYMYGGRMSLPIVVRAIVGKGWGQGSQHSQALHSLFAHIPGLKVVMPATPYDAKGLLIASIEDPSPVIFIEHRSLFNQSGFVPEIYFSIPLGRGRIYRWGSDVTIVAVSEMVWHAERASQVLREDEVLAEIIDLRTVKPLDEEIILNSVKKTGKLIIADIGHTVCGIASEVSALVAEKAFDYLTSPIIRIALADIPTPCSYALEEMYYKGAREIVAAARELLGLKMNKKFNFDPLNADFKGPF
jgi:pyruvate dehydrogenase E1 component beta subunit